MVRSALTFHPAPMHWIRIGGRGPMGERGKGRTLFTIDPDGNETEVNTRYLYGVPTRA